MLIDGRRPLLGEGVPRGDVGTVLREAPCDVGVLVAREDEAVAPGPDAPVLVPVRRRRARLGRARARRLAAPRPPARRCSLLGARADERGRARREPRCSPTPSLLVQQFAGVPAEPVVAEPGREGIARGGGGRRAARHRALGPLARGGARRPSRREIAARRAGADPVRAPRPAARRAGARDDVTRFTWSSPAMRGIPAHSPQARGLVHTCRVAPSCSSSSVVSARRGMASTPRPPTVPRHGRALDDASPRSSRSPDRAAVPSRRASGRRAFAVDRQRGRAVRPQRPPPLRHGERRQGDAARRVPARARPRGPLPVARRPQRCSRR